MLLDEQQQVLDASDLLTDKQDLNGCMLKVKGPLTPKS